MGIGAKHFYRFRYLKSEHWKNLRIAKLASVRARCLYCWKRGSNNDVHHLNYRSLYDVTLKDLVVLCRDCHNKFHEVILKFTEVNDSPDSKVRSHSIIKILCSLEGKTVHQYYEDKIEECRQRDRARREADKTVLG
jgi:hypothetical protein